MRRVPLRGVQLGHGAARVQHGRIGAGEPVDLEALGRALQGMDWQASDYFYEFLDVNLGNTPAGDKWREILSFVT
ncbi:hypothetical protein ACWGKW_01430 [Streptomyces sp. NPDC054766]